MSEDKKPEDVEVAEPVEEAAPAAEAPSMGVSAPAPAVPEVEPPPVAEASTPEVPEEEAPAVEAPTAVAPMEVAAPAPMTPEQRATEKTQDTVNFSKELSMGTVNPKTYHDLFNDKSTLGKVGTIFGLLLSGAGSGLTHQPNALLEMMNKEIERDFEAQKTNQHNKQSWYTLAMQHEKNSPEVRQLYAQAASAEEKAKLDAWLNKKSGVDDIAATANGMNAATALALHNNQDLINMMPPGPKKDAAQWKQDNEAIPFFINKAFHRNVEAEQKKDLVGAANPMPQPKGNPPPKGAAVPGTRYDAYNKGDYAKRAALGRQLGENAGRVPGAIPIGAQPEIEAEVKDLTANRNTYADAVKSFQHLAEMPLAGQAPGVGLATKVASGLAGLIPGTSGSASGVSSDLRDAFEQERATQMKALTAKMARGNISPDEARAVVESFMPNFMDTPKQRDLKFEQLKNHFTSMKEEEAPAVKKFGLYYAAPNYKYKTPSESKKRASDDSAAPAGGAEPEKKKSGGVNFAPANSGKNKL